MRYCLLVLLIASSMFAKQYKCERKVYCSQMKSCEEAVFYLDNCPGVKIDGDGDGIPCVKQFCNKDYKESYFENKKKIERIRRKLKAQKNR